MSGRFGAGRTPRQPRSGGGQFSSQDSNSSRSSRDERLSPDGYEVSLLQRGERDFVSEGAGTLGNVFPAWLNGAAAAAPAAAAAAAAAPAQLGRGMRRRRRTAAGQQQDEAAQRQHKRRTRLDLEREAHLDRGHLDYEVSLLQRRSGTAGEGGRILDRSAHGHRRSPV